MSMDDDDEEAGAEADTAIEPLASSSLDSQDGADDDAQQIRLPAYARIQGPVAADDTAGNA